MAAVAGRTISFVATVFLLVGALVVGGTLDRVVFESSGSLAAPGALVGLVGGFLLLATGWLLHRRTDPTEFVSDPDPDDDEDDWAEEDYIFSDAELERRERQ